MAFLTNILGVFGMKNVSIILLLTIASFLMIEVSFIFNGTAWRTSMHTRRLALILLVASLILGLMGTYLAAI